MVTISGGGRHENTLTRSELVIFFKARKPRPYRALYASWLGLSADSEHHLNHLFAHDSDRQDLDSFLIPPDLRHLTNFQESNRLVGAACVSWAIVAISSSSFNAAQSPASRHRKTCSQRSASNSRAYYKGISGAHVGLDVIILCMPLPMIWGLKLPVTQKMVLSSTFMLGGL